MGSGGRVVIGGIHLEQETGPRRILLINHWLEGLDSSISKSIQRLQYFHITKQGSSKVEG
jgi:hypothetical protein